MRVLGVEHHEVFRTGLRSVLDDEGFELADAPDAETAFASVAGFEPDVVVMDADLPETSGVEATRAVLRLAPHAAVVMMSLFEDENALGRAVHAGAVGSLRKDARLDEIVSAIEAAAHSARSRSLLAA
jgi:DNA-binding NarL/FixJ family response regulator